MIIPDTSTPRPRGTVLPFAKRGRADDAPARPQPPLGDRDGPVRRASDLLTLAAEAEQFLDAREADPDQDPFTLEDDAAAAFDALFESRFAGRHEAAETAGLMRAAVPLREAFLARARDIGLEARDVHYARQVFAPAERIFAVARENPDGKGHLFDGLADLTDQLPIARARKDEVAAALMARAVRDGVDGLMGPRFDRHRGRAQALIEEIARVEEGDAAVPDGVQPADAGAGDAPLILAGAGAVPVDAADQNRIRLPSRKTVGRAAIRALAATGAVPAALAALLLAASTERAGPETQVLDRELKDGRRVRLRYNPSERLATIAVATPRGAQVALTLERTADGTFSVIDAAVSENGGVGAAVPRPELAGIVDALTPAFAEQGLRIEIGGDGEVSDDEPASDDDELDSDSEALDDNERPDLGKPGTRRNPDGTPKHPLRQLDEIDRAQRRDREGIRSKKKSEQNVKHYLDRLK